MRGTCLYLALLASTAAAGPLARPPPLLSPSQTTRPDIRDIDQYITQVRSILSHCPQDSSCWERLVEVYPNLSDALEPGNEAKLLRRDDNVNVDVSLENRRVPSVDENLKLLDLALKAATYCADMALPECLQRLEAAYPGVKPPKIDLPEVAPPVFTPPATVPPQTWPTDCEPPSGHYRWTLIKRSLKYCPRSPMPFKKCWALLKKAMPDLPEEFQARPAARAVTTGSFFVSDMEDVDRRGQA
ncbi:hypothetical protein CSOJ01_07932 [Colletotrichum sojae]|uniref:Uncharacterized protein n=1 Tax=Colletotrichum sojae TaxID=2175907 RepID=A0A8H6J871_9PEZI|nr:hypothetical protein CSOJ01_07932 [Colletotrichum sojae]